MNEAHEHAQGKIHKFLGLDEEDGNRIETLPQTPEEAKVIMESRTAVSFPILSSPLFSKSSISSL